jgi:hypothetical protein
MISHTQVEKHGECNHGSKRDGFDSRALLGGARWTKGSHRWSGVESLGGASDDDDVGRRLYHNGDIAVLRDTVAVHGDWDRVV